jgi:hypothetical protein
LSSIVYKNDKQSQNSKNHFARIDETISLLISNSKICPLENDVAGLKNCRQKIASLQKDIDSINLKIQNCEDYQTKNENNYHKNKSRSPSTNDPRSIKISNKKLSGKTDLEQMCALLDQKADVFAVNNLFKEIHEELDELPTKEQFENIILSVENKIPLVMSQAKWVWKSGKTIQGVVPWEVEVYNYALDRFGTGKTNTEIVIRNEGLYEISFGFFGRKHVVVDVYLNGEIAISTKKTRMNDSSDKYENRHSNGYAVGKLKRNDFLRFCTCAQ